MKSVLYAMVALGLTAIGVAAPLAASASVHVATEDPPITWSVQPADADGPDGRSWVEQTGDPGERLTDRLALRNLSDVDVEFRITAADGYFTDTGRFNMLAAADESIGAGSWIEIAPTARVAAGATVLVPFEVVIPGDATPGDHAAGVAASVLSDGTTADGTAVGVESRVGFRVMTRVTGTITPAAELADAVAEFRPSWNPFAPGSVRVSYTVQNSGNSLLQITDHFADETAERGELLPGESRRIEAAPVAAWPLIWGSVDWTVVGVAPDAGVEPVTLAAAVSYWAPPWAQLAVLAGLALVLIGVFGGRRRSRRRLKRLLSEAREDGRREAALLVDARR